MTKTRSSNNKNPTHSSSLLFHTTSVFLAANESRNGKLNLYGNRSAELRGAKKDFPDFFLKLRRSLRMERYLPRKFRTSLITSRRDMRTRKYQKSIRNISQRKTVISRREISKFQENYLFAIFLPFSRCFPENQLFTLHCKDFPK